MGLEKQGVIAGDASLFFKLCSDHLSIEAIPRKAARIDLARFKSQSLPGLELMLWTPRFVVLRTQKGYEVTLRRDGRMIIRRAPTEQVAERAAIDVMRLVASLS